MEITVHRDRPLATEPRQLPAAAYNLIHSLLARSPGTLFVPIRSMQYLAIVDAEEIVFVDYLRKTEAVIVWRDFRPQARTSLDQPVPYECCIHHPDGLAGLSRLHVEFPRAMQTLAERDLPTTPARVLKFERPHADKA